MKNIKTYSFVALVSFLTTLAASNLNAAYAGFLKIEGVEGESTAAGYEGEIEILSFSWGVSNPNAQATHGGGGGGGRVSLSELTIAKELDKSSPKLFRSAVLEDWFAGQGEEYPIRLVMVYTPDDGGESVEVFSIRLNNCQISELRSTVVPAKRGGGDDRPTESLSLSFTKIEMNYSGRHGDRYTGLHPADAIAVENPLSVQH